MEILIHIFSLSYKSSKFFHRLFFRSDKWWIETQKMSACVVYSENHSFVASHKHSADKQ